MTTYCTCKNPDINGSPEDGYWCDWCQKDMEPYEPDPDAEYEAQWENEQEKLSI